MKEFIKGVLNLVIFLLASPIVFLIAWFDIIRLFYGGAKESEYVWRFIRKIIIK
jgi:hypothetical protein